MLMLVELIPKVISKETKHGSSIHRISGLLAGMGNTETQFADEPRHCTGTLKQGFIGNNTADKHYSTAVSDRFWDGDVFTSTKHKAYAYPYMSTMSAWLATQGTLAAMWAELRKHLDIGPPTNLDGPVDLAVKQHDVPPNMEMIVAKRNLYASSFTQQDVAHTPCKQCAGNYVMPALGQSTPAGIMTTIPSPLMGVSSFLQFTETSASMPSSYLSEMTGHVEQCVDRDCELTGSNTT